MTVVSGHRRGLGKGGNEESAIIVVMKNRLAPVMMQKDGPLIISNERDKVFEAIAAGASGYLLKNASIGEIEEACRKLARGESSLDGAIARMMLGTFQNTKPKKVEHGLTDRELEILQQLASGLHGKEIARTLGISLATVNFHCGNLYKKLHVQSQRSAILEAKKRGIL